MSGCASSVGFSHGVGTFSEAGYCLCLEGRRRPSGQQLSLLTLASLKSYRLATKWLCNRGKRRRSSAVTRLDHLSGERERDQVRGDKLCVCFLLENHNNDAFLFTACSFYRGYEKREYFCVSVGKSVWTPPRTGINLQDDEQHPSGHGERIQSLYFTHYFTIYIYSHRGWA